MLNLSLMPLHFYLVFFIPFISIDTVRMRMTYARGLGFSSNIKLLKIAFPNSI